MKIMMLGCIGAAILLTLASLTSVVGTDPFIMTKGESVVDSPLFCVRTQQFVQKEKVQRISSNYIGKGMWYASFFVKRSSIDSWIDRAIYLSGQKPSLLDRVLDKMRTTPEFTALFEEYDLNFDNFEHYVTAIKHDPSLLQKDISILPDDVTSPIELPAFDYAPVGFSGQPGCLIAFFIVLPIFIMIGTMIATFTILTCLNFRGCFESIMQSLFEGLSQRLYPDLLG